MNKNKRKGSQGQESSSSSTTDPIPSSKVPVPPLEWEEHSQSLGPLLSSNSLPLVVACDRQCLPTMEHINFDFSQPLLLHTRRRVRKVVASNVVHVQLETETRPREVGDRLQIPEDYRGWFAVLGQPKEVKPEKVVPHFRQVAQLALSKCESFLIGGSEPVKAVQMPSPSGGGSSREVAGLDSNNDRDRGAQLRLVYPGDVLRMGKLYVGESTVKVKKSSLFGGKKTVKREEKFLLCTDDNDRELYLPVESRGTFYVLTTEGNGTPRIPILRVKDICVHYRFPCVVRLLFGCVPSTPCSFTGTLVLRESQIESSVIGCTMLNLRNILLDLPVDSDLKFFAAASTRELLMSRAYNSAKALCLEKVGTYMRNMKVAYYVNSEEDDPCDAREAGDREAAESLSASESTDSLSSRMSKPRPSIVEEQELFCPPETTPPPKSPGPKKATKSVPGSEITAPSPTVLKKDNTYSLPPPAESLPLKINKSLSLSNIKTRCPPAIATPVLPSQDTLPNVNSGYMTMGETFEERAVSKISKQSPVDPKTPPPTPPKPRKSKPLSHNHPDGSVYTQVWNGETVAEPNREKADDKPTTPVIRPKRLGLSCGGQRVSSIAFADTYLTLQVFKDDASSSMPADNSLTPPTPENTEADDRHTYYNTVNHERSSHPEETIYNVPSSIPLTSKLPGNPSTQENQPYEIMVNSAKLKLEDVKQDDQKPPTPPPKKRPTSAHTLPDGRSPRSTLLPPVPDTSPATESHDIVFENPSWMFSDTSSVQSCEYASRWLSGQPDPAYVHMHRQNFTYYEGYDPNKTHLPEDSGDTATEIKVGSFDQSAEQTETAQGASTEESEALYENIKNLRPCQERLSVSNSVTEESDTENHGHFIDKLANPPTMALFGYIKPPPPRPATPKKPPPVPKKPSSERLIVQDPVLDNGACCPTGGRGGSEARLSFPPKPCGTTADGAPSDYLHPCRPRLTADGYVQREDSSPRPLLRACLESSCSDVSEDDLPLGATFANFQSRMSDSGCAAESEVGLGVREQRESGGRSEVSSLSVADLAGALEAMGLTRNTVDTLRQNKVDGQLLVSLNEQELKQILPDNKMLDIKKIQMLVSTGWRPRE